MNEEQQQKQNYGLLIKHIKNRNNLLHKKTTNDPKSAYSKYSNFINKENKLSKKEYYQNYFENGKTDMKKYG